VTANYSSANLSVRLGDGSGGFGSAPNLSTGDTVFSLVAADFNSDGRTDFVGSNPNLGTLSLFRGNGDGTFAAPTSIPLAASAPVGLALADMNRDGGFDVVVADWNGAVWVLLGDGAGGFSPVRTAAPGTNPYFVDVADFNGDDRPDVLVSNQTPATVSLFMGNGSGGLGAPTQFPTLAGTDTRQVAAVDVNGDRRPDVVLAGMTSPSRAVFVLLGDGSGGLGAPAAFTTGHYPSSFAAADFTGDGVVDLAVAASNVAILAGNGAGGFEAPIRTVGGGSGAPYRPLLADFNRDGRLDLAARGGTNQLSVYLGDGFGGFGGATNVTVGDTPRPIAADLDGNGTLDLATANLGDNNVSVVLGNGDGTFAPAVNYASGTGPMSLAPMDVDRDGRLDLVVSLGTGSLRVLRGLGGGNFGAGTTIPLSGGGLLAVGDLDGNGTGDVVVQQAFQSVAVVLGDGFGGFSSTTLVDAGTSTGPVALSDLNRDGRLDLVVGSDLNNVVAVLLGDGLGGFGSPSLFAVGLRPVYLAIGDVNADGRADIVASGGSTPTPGMVAVLLGDGAGGFSAPKGYQAGGGAPSVALGDVNRDGRTDVVLANGTDNSYWTLLNSNCKTRGMLFTQNVSSCNLPSTPFASQPVLSVVDDGANVIQCAAGNVGAQIMWNTGTPGATLGGTIAVSPVAGVATYTDLSVNFVGSGYQLLFTHAGARNAWSRRFNVGAPVITGAASFCQTASVVYDVGAGYESYAWTLDGGPVLSRLRNVTLSGVSPGLRELMVTVTQAECTDTQTLWVDVGAALSGVSIAMIGADGVCPTCTGGTASVTDTGGGSTTHQWGYRTVSGGTITAISGQTGSAYQLNGANFPGVGSYFLVVTTTPSCGSATVSNEIPVSVYTTVVGDAVVVFTVTSKDGGNTLEWLNPAIGVNYAATRIQYNVGSPACTAPSGPFAGTHLVRRVGSADAHDMTTHSGLTNGTSYCYAAFVEHAGLAFGDGRPTKGRPFDTTNAVKWAFSTGATTMAPPAIGPAAIYSASNDLVLHGMVRGLTGSAGLWPAGWRPYLLDQPTHHRMGVGTTDVVLGSSRVAFLGSQDGYVYAVDADTGVERWQSGVRLGDYVETAPVAMLQGFGGIVDQVYAGSENSAPPNAFYALNAANGVVVSAFDNGGGTTAIGAIVGGGAVDYALNRVYFTSHEGPGGANRTLWCLGITGGGLVDNCGWPPLTLGETDLGNVDNAPTLRNGVIYVGNTTGTVYAVDALTRTERWHYDTLDGAVKGFVFPDRNSNRVYFATEGVAANPGHVWGLVDNGVGLVALAWPSVAISAPSIALFTPGGTHILVGSDDGQLHQLDVSGGPPATTSIQLGDGSAAVGSPSYDPYNNCVYAGSEAGVIYAVELPLP
jgi:outer membrane protein assembly factor BamB